MPSKYRQCGGLAAGLDPTYALYISTSIASWSVSRVIHQTLRIEQPVSDDRPEEAYSKSTERMGLYGLETEKLDCVIVYINVFVCLYILCCDVCVLLRRFMRTEQPGSDDRLEEAYSYSTDSDDKTILLGFIAWLSAEPDDLAMVNLTLETETETRIHSNIWLLLNTLVV